MLRVFLLSLGLTLAIELPVAALWGLRRRELLLCALVNLLTNPVVVALHYLFPAWWATPLLECAAWAVEGLYYRRYAPGASHPWLLSLSANGCSFALGLVLNRFLW